jgi:serine/threonine protein kinase
LKTKPGELLAEATGEPRWRVVEPLAEGRSFHLAIVEDLHVEGHRAVAKSIRYQHKDPEHVLARRTLLDGERDIYLLPATMIPEPLDWLIIGEEPVLIYEHQSGETLEEVVRTRHKEGLGSARALRLVRELALFASEVHAAGFVLRDLSPAHVVLGLDDVLQVVGLGNAAPARAARPADRHKTSFTEGFSAPELTRASEVRPSADVYSLGALLVYLATGDRTGRLSGPIGDACGACLAGDPAVRPSASDVYEMLRRAGTLRAPRPEPVRAPTPARAPEPRKEPAAPAKKKEIPAKKAEPPPAPAKRRWGIALFWVLLLVGLAAGITTAIYFFRTK